MKQQVKSRFLELKITGQRGNMSSEEKKNKDLELIKYLEDVIANKEVTDFEDIGFCYWNISDNYALLRDGHALRRNHRAFYEHIMAQDKSYLYWLVCDATQRLTLEKDGYSDWWWSVYREAVSDNRESANPFVEFCAHRAALYKNPVSSVEKSCITFATEHFEEFLAKTQDTLEYPFYRMIYLTSLSKYAPVDSMDINMLAESLLPDLACTDEPGDFLVGEWKSFITPFGKRKCAIVGITSAVNALIDMGELKSAKDIYQGACENGLPGNALVEKRLDENRI